MGTCTYLTRCAGEERTCVTPCEIHTQHPSVCTPAASQRMLSRACECACALACARSPQHSRKVLQVPAGNPQPVLRARKSGPGAVQTRDCAAVPSGL
eukprot:2521589-Rhodomonas_salina.6